MLMLVDLYYAEKRSVIPGAQPDGRFTTNETLALSGVSRAEADSYIARFSHIRSVWRIKDHATERQYEGAGLRDNNGRSVEEE